MPFPNTRVIPNGWAAHHRPVAEGGMTAAVHIPGPPGESTWDDETQTTRIPPGADIYLGPARIQLLTLTEAQRMVAEQEITTLAYLVAITLEATDVDVNDEVIVDQVHDDGDQSLVGRRLRVRAVARGSLAWERDLVCTDDLG